LEPGIDLERVKRLKLTPVLAEGAAAADPVDACVPADIKRHPARAPDVLPQPRGIGITAVIVVAEVA
jgi:hypothetical protein